MSGNGKPPAEVITAAAGGRNELGQFLPGGRNGGRPRGVRNKLSHQFLLDLHASWLEHGKDVITHVINKKPHLYLKIVADLLPSKAFIEVEHSGLFDDARDFATAWKLAQAKLRGEGEEVFAQIRGRNIDDDDPE